ncbi:TPA: lipopolysaccharide biosynthesis protein [Streptococcus suis]
MKKERIEIVNYKKIGMYYMFGTLFNQGLSFLAIPFFSRILSTFDYGIINTYTSWVTITSMVISCALHMGIRASFIDNERNIDDVMSSVTSFTLLNGVVISTIVIVANLIFDIGNTLLIFLCLLQALATGLIQNYTMLLMMQYRYRLRTILLVVPNVLAVVVSFLLIFFVLKSQLYLGRIIPWSVIQTIFGILTLIYVYTKSTTIWNSKYIKDALTVSVPLVLHGIALNILSQSDRVMITALRDASETGIYSLVYNLGMIATVITTSLEGVWVPWFTQNLKEGDVNIINKRANLYTELITLSMGILILVGPEIIKILADSKYWEGIVAIPPVVLANYLLFIYTLYVNVEHYYKKTIAITTNTVVVALLNIILNFLFIPHYGYLAAAYTSLFAYFAAFLLHSTHSRKLNSSLFPLKSFVFPFTKLAIIVVLFYLLLDSLVIRWSMAVLLTSYELFRYRVDLIPLLPVSVRKLFDK